MKKPPVQWVVMALTVLCVLFAAVSCFKTISQLRNTQEKLDRTQLSMLSTQDEIEEIQKKREEKEKAARQKALDEKKAKEAKAAAGQADQGEEQQEEQQAQEDAQTEEEDSEEETINSFTSTANGKIVGIDPGHQGSWVDMSALEPNAPGSSEMKARCTTGTAGNFTQLPEYELNLNVSLKLRDILESRGYQVVMTREDNDANISNAERAQKVSEAGADIYVRIHANSSDDTSVSGALTMSPSAQNPYVGNLYEESYRLSEVILNSYCQATGIGNRGVTLTDTMTGINWSTIPVTIVEMGFMSNQGDDTKMADEQFQQTMAEGIANGIDAYFAQ